MIRVLVVAAYASVRAGLRTLLEGGDDIGPVLEAAPGDDLGGLGSPEVIVYDVNEIGWRDLAESFASSGAALVVLTDGSVPPDLITQSSAGFGWLSKDADREDLLSAVRAAASGLVAMDRIVAAKALHPDQTLGERRPSELSGREQEVLQLMAAGLANKQIAARLDISLSTVKFHVASVMAKLEAASRTEAVTAGLRRGLVRV